MKPIEDINSKLIHGRWNDSHCILYTNSMTNTPIHGIIVAWFTIRRIIRSDIKL
jgi:hypothetical protein